MISMQIFNGGLAALVSLVVAAIAVTGLMMAAPRLSRAGGAGGTGGAPHGGTRPDLSPEPLPNPDVGSFVIPDDARELTGDRELTLV
jgi:hypothetical protein